MKYYSEEEIGEMKLNCCESKTIEQARNNKARADALISEITNAFKNVKLNGGVGLNVAQGLSEGLDLRNRPGDDEDKAVYKKLKRKDEKNNWQNIPIKELNRCNSSLNNFDADGLRFHLPAYMIAEIKGECDFEMGFCLCDKYNYSYVFSTLEPAERKVIVLFLEYIYEQEKYLFYKGDIQKSLETYWRN